MSSIDPERLVARMQSVGGVRPETVATLEAAGVDIRGWLRGFESVHTAVQQSCARVRAHPLVPSNVPVHGLVIDPTTGALELVVDGLALAEGGGRGPIRDKE